MGIDAGIYNALGVRPKSMMDYQTEYNTLDQQRNALAQSNMQLQQAQSLMQQRNALRAAVQGGQLDLTDPAHQGNALAIAPDVAPALLKTIQEGRTSAALAGKDTAQAKHFDAQTTGLAQDQAIKAHDQHLQQLQGVSSPDELVQWIRSGVGTGALDLNKGAAMAQALQQDPSQFGAIKQSMLANGVAIQERFKQEAENARNAANNATSVANNAATNATHVQTTGMTNATARANNQANIAKDYAVAGVLPGGGLSPQMETMAQGIARGEIAPLSGFALARPGGQALMGRVMQINPQYDATTYGAKAQAAKAFTSGQQGNSMRSFAVAGQHLDQLGQLVDAMNNGNMQLVNKIGNAYSQQTGSPAVTNFDAAKDVVSKEVVKAIVAGGGGVAEREELSKLMSSAKSPAQLKGVISQYRNLMAAQHDALLQQRRAAGLPDSTLPAYTDPSGGGGANADLHSQADAILRGSK